MCSPASISLDVHQAGTLLANLGKYVCELVAGGWYWVGCCLVGIEQGASIVSIASIEQAAGIAGIEQAAGGDHLNVSSALSGSSQHHLAAPSSLASKFTFQVFRFSGFQCLQEFKH